MPAEFSSAWLGRGVPLARRMSASDSSLPTLRRRAIAGPRPTTPLAWLGQQESRLDADSRPGYLPSSSGAGLINSGKRVTVETRDEVLLQRATAGDETALTALLECHGAEVRAQLQRSYRGRLKGQVDLDDVMQVTYLEAFLSIREFAPARANAFRAWLRRIAENNLRDALRKFASNRSRAAPIPSWEDSCRALLEPPAGTSTPSRTVGKAEVQRLLKTALQQLPADYERVLRLHDLEGHSGPDVARLIGRSHGAVKMLIARARDRLRATLGSSSKFFSDA